MASTVIVLSSFFLLLHLVVGGPTGFTLKVIHRDSIESPLYPGNLTREERFQRLAHQTKARARRIVSTISTTGSDSNHTGSTPDMVRPPVDFEGSHYIAMVGIGTIGDPPNYNIYNFVIDTGSDLIWTQCEGCIPCFPQTAPLFPYHRSSTYQYLPCDRHPLCFPGRCAGVACSYKEAYLGSATTGPCTAAGLLSSETFTFNSDIMHTTEKLENLVFGCGLEQINMNLGAGDNNQIAGILGLGGGSRSFLSQLGPRANGRFSYCLFPWLHIQGMSTYLRFGDDIKIGEPVLTTPFIPSKTETYYYLDLHDISIAGVALDFHRDIFQLKPDGSGGVVMDSGSPWSAITREAFQRVRGAMALYYLPYTLVSIDPKPFHMDLCYKRPRGFNNFPTITFHFEMADLEVGPDGGFIIFEDVFCLAILPLDMPISIIGAYQQINYRFVYDTNEYALSFVKEKCDLDA